MKKLLVKLLVPALLLGLAAAGVLFSRAAAASPPSITKQPSDAVVYVGDAVKLSVTVTGGQNIAYQWYKNTIKSNSGGFKVVGATAASMTVPTDYIGTYYYYCKVYSSMTSITTISSAPATVTVKAAPEITSQPSGASVYAGQSVTLAVAASGSGTLTYQWYSSTTKSEANAVKIINAESPTYSVPTASAGTTYYFCVVTNTDPDMTSSPTRSVRSSIVRVTVSALGTNAPIITAQPSPTAVYKGTPAQVSVAAAATGTLSYQWHSTPTGKTEDGVPIPGATRSSYDLPTAAEGTLYYYCVVTNTISGASAQETYQTVSSIVPCTVKAPTVITAQPAGKTAFVGEHVTLSVTATGSGTLTYQWYKSAVGTIYSGNKISGATGPSYTVPTTSTDTAWYYCVVTNTDGNITSAVKTSTATSDMAQVVVLVESITPPVISQQPASATVYTGTLTRLSVTATGTGVISYQWYSAETDAAEDGTPIAGAISATYTVLTDEPGTAWYYCVITNTADCASGRESMAAVSAAATVTVLTLPSIDAQPSDATVSSGNQVTLSVGAGGSGVLSYQWYQSKTDKPSGTRISGATGATYTFQAKNLGVSYYYCVVTNTDNRITEKTKTAVVTSRPAKVTVVSADADPPVITKQPSGVTVAAGMPATLSVTAAGNGTLSYQWFMNTKKSTSGATPIAGATNAVYAPPTESAGKVWYYCQVTNTDVSRARNQSRSVLTGIVCVTVNPLNPTITKQPASARVYTGTPLDLTVKATGCGVLSYQWYAGLSDADGAGTPVAGAVGPTFTVPTSAAGSRYYYCVVTNTVASETGSISGTTATAAAYVDVVPCPSITLQPADATLTGGEHVTLTVAVACDGVPSYQWYKAGSSGAAGVPIKKATGPSYSFKTATQKTTKTAYYYCVVTVTDKTMTKTPKYKLKSAVATVTITAKSG